MTLDIQLHIDLNTDKDKARNSLNCSQFALKDIVSMPPPPPLARPAGFVQQERKPRKKKEETKREGKSEEGMENGLVITSRF